MTDRELMQQALDALSGAVPSGYIKDRVDKHYQVMEALRARLAQPEPELPRFPTMLRKMWSGSEVQDWINENWNTAPPRKEWQGLTDEEYKIIHNKNYNYEELARAIEAKLKEKNSG